MELCPMNVLIVFAILLVTVISLKIKISRLYGAYNIGYKLLISVSYSAMTELYNFTFISTDCILYRLRNSSMQNVKHGKQ